MNYIKNIKKFIVRIFTKMCKIVNQISSSKIKVFPSTIFINENKKYSEYVRAKKDSENY